MKSAILFVLLITSTSALLSGVDTSLAELFESNGVIYRNAQGQPTDLFQLVAENSIDIVRLRLFTANEEQAKKDPYDYGNTLNLTLRLAQRIKTHGLQFMLDFHYSDTWADPSHQTKPSAWADLPFEQLTNTLYNYTRDSLRAFVEQDTIPQYIQIGNEIIHGMLWPDGYLDGSDWTKFLTLLNAASQGVRAVLKNQTNIVVHVTSSTDWPTSKHYFDQLIGKIDFDTIGLSYYPYWDGGFTGLRFCLEQLSRNYDKQIFIVETDYRWEQDKYTNDSMKNITGFDETPEGQMQYAEYVEKILINATDPSRESALFWWATEYVAAKSLTKLGGYELRSFFNASGVALPIMENFGKFKRSAYDGKIGVTQT